MYKIVINWQIPAWHRKFWLYFWNSLWYWTCRDYSMALKVIITIVITKQLPRNPASFANRVRFTPRSEYLVCDEKLEWKGPSQDAQGSCWVKKCSITSLVGFRFSANSWELLRVVLRRLMDWRWQLRAVRELGSKIPEKNLISVRIPRYISL